MHQAMKDEFSVSDTAQLPVEEKIPFSLIRATFLITIPSFVHGYVVGALNACLVTGDDDDGDRCYNGDDDGSISERCPRGTIYNDIRLTTTDAQLATSLIIVGAYVGCLLGSTVSERFGRKKGILWNNIFFIAGALLCGLGNTIEVIFVGRAITGLGFGIETVVVPVLLSEVARPENRGRLTTMHQLQLTVGIMVVGLLSYCFVIYVDQGWRYVQLFYALPCVLMVALSGYIPESPKYLVALKRLDEAEEALRLVRSPGFDVKAEVQALVQMERDENQHRAEELEAPPTWAEVFACRRAVIIGIGLQLAGAFTGINTIMLYSATIFGFANVDDPVLAAAFVGVVNVLSTLVSVQLMDKHGRRTLLQCGTSIMSASLVVLALVLLLANGNEAVQGYIAVFAILVFVFGFAIGLGAVSWVVMAEIMPTRLRTKAYGMFVSISYGCNLFIGLLTLTAIKQMGGSNAGMDDDETNDANKRGVAYLYAIFAVISAAACAFISAHVPETKGKQPKDFMEHSEGEGEGDDHDAARTPLLAH